MSGENEEREELDTAVQFDASTSSDELSATPRRATNIGGGGQADNTCDCATVGVARAHEPMPQGVNGSALFVLAFVALFARRRRID